MMLRSIAALFLSLPVPVALVAQTIEAGRGALRPYVHIFLAYGIAWILIAFWVWMISRQMKRMAAREPGDAADRVDG